MLESEASCEGIGVDQWMSLVKDGEKETFILKREKGGTKGHGTDFESCSDHKSYFSIVVLLSSVFTALLWLS